MENAGLNARALLAEVENGKAGYGVNVMTPEKDLVDLKKNGVIDPAKVTKEAVKNATSIAATAITMGALISRHGTNFISLIASRREIVTVSRVRS